MLETEQLVSDAIYEKSRPTVDNRAFEQLVRRYQDMVYAYIYSKILDPYSAQDIVHESFSHRTSKTFI